MKIVGDPDDFFKKMEKMVDTVVRKALKPIEGKIAAIESRLDELTESSVNQKKRADEVEKAQQLKSDELSDRITKVGKRLDVAEKAVKECEESLEVHETNVNIWDHNFGAIAAHFHEVREHFEDLKDTVSKGIGGTFTLDGGGTADGWVLNIKRKDWCPPLQGEGGTSIPVVGTSNTPGSSTKNPNAEKGGDGKQARVKGK